MLETENGKLSKEKPSTARGCVTHVRQTPEISTRRDDHDGGRSADKIIFLP